MKLFNILLLCMFIAIGSSCTKKTETDSTEIAEDQNEEKFDETALEDDSEFVLKAAEGGLLEVKLGELAQAQASSPQVKEFAQQMIADHSKANSELQALATQKNISVPTALGEDKQKKYDDLAAKKGADFDEAYSEFMVKDHKDDVDLFQKEADKGNDAEIKAWAAKTLPTLQHHLEMAETAEKSADAKD